jgi:hypothetical protein
MLTSWTPVRNMALDIWTLCSAFVSAAIQLKYFHFVFIRIPYFLFTGLLNLTFSATTFSFIS